MGDGTVKVRKHQDAKKRNGIQTTAGGGVKGRGEVDWGGGSGAGRGAQSCLPFSRHCILPRSSSHTRVSSMNKTDIIKSDPLPLSLSLSFVMSLSLSAEENEEIKQCCCFSPPLSLALIVSLCPSPPSVFWPRGLKGSTEPRRRGAGGKPREGWLFASKCVCWWGKYKCSTWVYWAT